MNPAYNVLGHLIKTYDPRQPVGNVLERVRSGLKKPTAAVVDKQKAEHRMAILQGENNK
jgi:hypothetical protein